MKHVSFVYDKYKDLIVRPLFCKSRIDNEFLIVMNSNLETIYLTGTAKELMLKISNGIKVDDLFQFFSENYDVDEITLKSDIIDFIKDMQWKDIILLTSKPNMT